MGPDPATVPPVFRWYGLVTAGTPLEQGDIFLRFPVLEPPTLSADDIDQAQRGVAPSLDADLKLYDLIVLSQSCDLQDMLPSAHVILCSLIDLRKATKADGKTLATPQEYGNLRTSRHVGAHLLNLCDIAGHAFEFKVVDLQRIVSVPRKVVDIMSAQAPYRVRLLPPYREHLAQAFARQFMRVGLPSILPEKYPYAASTSVSTR